VHTGEFVGPVTGEHLEVEHASGVRRAGDGDLDHGSPGGSVGAGAQRHPPGGRTEAVEQLPDPGPAHRRWQTREAGVVREAPDGDLVVTGAQREGAGWQRAGIDVGDQQHLALLAADGQGGLVDMGDGTAGR
jgi:hypothetical protein